jgi:uncharacterized membrane protein
MILATGLGLGAGLTYLLDPDKGRRRRALLRDKAVRAVHRVNDCINVAARDVRHRSCGLKADARALFNNGEQTSDRVLTERVRSKLGRLVSHPHSIQVTADRGQVRLSGPILEREVCNLLAGVSSVRGVTSVENRLEVHREPDVPGLQGEPRRAMCRTGSARASWSPEARLLAGAVGCGLMANCLARRTPAAAFLGTVGFGLFLRGWTNLDARRLTGLGCGRRAVDVSKTITFNAPVEQVFDFWANYENFPRFMSHLREVCDRGNGHSHWVATGPAGVPVTWNAFLTRVVPNELLAWKSEPGSAVANAGAIRFERMGDSRTRVTVRLSYNPPVGALGHAAALVFGADPKSAMDEDLVRLKSLLEEGKASAPGKKATREELAAREPAPVPVIPGPGIPVL